MSSAPGGSTQTKSRGHFSELLKVETKLALREPLGLGTGVGLPFVLLLIFGFIGKAQPGNVGNTGLTVLDLYIPTIMVIGFVFLVLQLHLVKEREVE